MFRVKGSFRPIYLIWELAGLAVLSLAPAVAGSLSLAGASAGSVSSAAAAAGSLSLSAAFLLVEPLYPSASLFPLVTLPPTAGSGLVAASSGTLTLAAA